VVELRKLKRFEFVDFLKILHKIFPERANPSLFLSLYEIFPDGFVVAVDGEKIVGFAVGVISQEEKGRILLIGVDEDYRNKGIGSKLLKRILLVLSLRGVREVELEVRASNVHAIKFYDKMGFRKKDRIRDYYEDGEDAYIMAKYL